MRSVRAMLGSLPPGGSDAPRVARSSADQSSRILANGLVVGAGGTSRATPLRLDRALAGWPNRPGSEPVLRDEAPREAGAEVIGGSSQSAPTCRARIALTRP